MQTLGSALINVWRIKQFLRSRFQAQLHSIFPLLSIPRKSGFPLSQGQFQQNYKFSQDTFPSPQVVPLKPLHPHFQEKTVYQAFYTFLLTQIFAFLSPKYLHFSQVYCQNILNIRELAGEDFRDRWSFWLSCVTLYSTPRDSLPIESRLLNLPSRLSPLS